MSAIALQALADETGGQLVGDSVALQTLVIDSREVKDGDLFAALRYILVKQIRQLTNDDSAQLVDIGDGDCAPVISRDVMTDADSDELHR